MLKKFNQKISEGFLYTDQYQLVMAQFYFRNNLHKKRVQFEHYFRDYPDYGTHKAGYCINAGLEWFIDWMTNSFISKDELEYLRNQKNSKGERLFADDFLKWLSTDGKYSEITLKSIEEGRVVHPNIPLNVVQGPLAITQILETPLLNQMNYQLLIATKASRIKEIAKGQPLLEFGLRRAQDRGANAGTRAALIGGADFSSNVGTSYLLGIPPKGTHAHSMVQMFIAMGGSELDAFQAFADLYPDDCILLIDTINTLESGLPNAIRVFHNLKKKGHKPVGVRLDSGDLAYLSIKVAKMLNEAGLNDVNIVLSNELDELNIWQIISQITEEAHKESMDADEIIGRLIFGVGTRLITSAGDPALGGVYKLTAVDQDGKWKPAIKISDTVEKLTNPGEKQVWRIYDTTGNATADLICLKDETPAEEEKLVLRHPSFAGKKRSIEKNQVTKLEPLLTDIMNDGKLIYDFPTISQIRLKRKTDIEKLDTGVKRLINPHYYHVSISQKLWSMKQRLIDEVKNGNQS
ncbi:MAG: nicotinate phosphoribosyltransferase [Ignavibacteriaceae bacterium]